MAATKPTLQPYIRSTLPVIPGGERIWSDNEFKKLESALNSLRAYVEDLEKRLSAVEAKAK